MRTKDLFEDIDAGVAKTSDTVDFQQRAEWVLVITSSGLDGVPRIIIEFSIDDTTWFPIVNETKKAEPFFEIDDPLVTILYDTLQASSFRIRLDPNGNTAGLLSADFGYKTFP